MKLHQAEKIYFKNLRTPEKTISRLRKWNPKKTILENAQIIGCSPSNANQLAYRFKLLHKISTTLRNQDLIDVSRDRAILSHYLTGKSKAWIAREMGISRQRVHQILQRRAKYFHTKI